jgi:drug/metabolite transporter (DMT)-like permease
LNKNLLAHFALLGSGIIYAFNYIIAKEVMPQFIGPLAFVVLRVVGAILLFWFVSSFFARERIDKKDLRLFWICGIFGVAVNQLFFFQGLSITTPINAAIIMTTNPIIVLLFAAFLLNERITLTKVVGIALGLIGASVIILSGSSFSLSSAGLWGDLFIFLNSISWALYLVLVKRLFLKYHHITIMKWVFLYGSVFVLPIGMPDIVKVEWQEIPAIIWLGVLYVVIFVTFLAYLLNNFALSKLQSSTVSAYIYLQPVLASIIAILLGKDILTWKKTLAMLLIFTGVYLTSKKVKVLKTNQM